MIAPIVQEARRALGALYADAALDRDARALRASSASWPLQQLRGAARALGRLGSYDALPGAHEQPAMLRRAGGLR